MLSLSLSGDDSDKKSKYGEEGGGGGVPVGG